MKLLLSLCFTFLFYFSNAQPLRELRGVWLTTFSNIDWPKRGETPQQQRESLLRILDVLKETGINTVYMQVRSQCDAMYNSSLEPWSADLTGTQGMAPAENWDPLHFAIEECHKRGMDLHAWLNPYRAVANIGALPYFSSQHIAKRRPDWLLAAGTLRTLDPGIPEVRQHILTVISDIVNRYDVDGIHFDDYFYPEGSFNDNATFAKFPRGISNKNDWRRNNVDLLIEESFNTIRKIKPWVKFGVSPTGIYENSADPNKGTRTTGKQHYSELFSDTRKWLREGWIDYLEPQVYWYSRQPGSPFNDVALWWADQRYDRHMYIGLAGYKVGMEKGWWSASEIPDQVRLLRSPLANGISGLSIYNTSSLLINKLGYRDSLKHAFRLPAMVPEMHWMDSVPPEGPLSVSVTTVPNGARISWTLWEGITEEMDKPRMLAIYRFRDTSIEHASSNLLAVIYANGTREFVDETAYEHKMWYRVTLVDRLWNESEPSYAVSYAGPVHR
ncbi:MAG: glycoside hydrolase, partial [Chitinophagaceae bacterium]